MSTVNANIRLGYQNAAWFVTNAALVLLSGQIVYRSTDGKYIIGDGVTAVSGLTFYGGVATSYTSSNGITLTGSNFALGGALTGNTNLSGAYTLYMSDASAKFCVGRSNPDRLIEAYSTGLSTMQAYSSSSTSYAGVYAQSNDASNYISIIQSSTSYGFVDGLRIANSSFIDSAGVILGIWNNNVAGDVVIATGGHATANEKLRFTPTTTRFINSTFSVGNPTGTGVVTLRDMSGVGSTSNAIYFGTAAPSTTNHILAWDTSSTYLNVPGSNSVYIQTGGTNRVRIGSNFLLLSDAVNIIVDTTTGSKIGTATTQKLSFWNATPIVQPTTAVTAATIVGGAGTTVKEDHTFDGYTIAQVVKALRNTGLLA
jgi:hypothetical protein